MTDTLLNLHSIVRWIVLVAAIGALVALLLARREGGWTRLTQLAATAYVASLSVQFLLGVALWISEERWSGGSVFRSWIHPLAMIAAVAIAHAGFSRARREADPERKNKIASISFGVSFLLLVLFIPW